ncbi:MAG: carotenoid oxygenase family protein [Sphingomonadaceae bacterium]|uniref:8'-apo-carotenoid 13,14-cleaving dioxygenase n=1 Tax=Thermaurantiacus sp. TaxID=2820283 RepID=UPI00298EE2C4|nr:carotenoid oxygenase family protein [Thermaurantiacus sp.]MCS6987335.1 carotenoid oxygenase family protein [Sphingomonadaceae bacterium]MDW8414556.1 carotenoid oxygenase family protein [Thermaurantiacus sp.]
MANVIERGIRSVVGAGVEALAAANRRRLPKPKAHPFLTGIFAPVAEERTIAHLAVEGRIPAELDGRYVRNGPNPLGDVDPRSYHWFLGDGMVHGVRLRDGRAEWYRNRWVRSTRVSEALGEPPAPGPRRGRSDNANTHVVKIAGRMLAIVEASAYPVELDGELGTVAHHDFAGTLRGSFSAHPHLDPATGEQHAVCYDPETPDVVRHVVVSSEGRVIRDEPVDLPGGVMIHDCALTPRFVAIFDLPVTFSRRAYVEGWEFPLRWNPDRPARVGLLPRDGSGADVRWSEVEPCSVFHVANAFEDGDRVVVDLVTHDRMFDRSGWGPDSRQVRFERWTLSPGAPVMRQVLDDTPQEFPRCDERRSTQPYRFAWCTGLGLGGEALQLGRCLVFHDLARGGRQVRDFGPGRVPGEFVFVPRAGGDAEDDGWLMGFVSHEDGDRAELVILNARDPLGEPQAVVHIPARIPAGFHGSWIPA